MMKAGPWLENESEDDFPNVRWTSILILLLFQLMRRSLELRHKKWCKNGLHTGVPRSRVEYSFIATCFPCLSYLSRDLEEANQGLL